MRKALILPILLGLLALNTTLPYDAAGQSTQSSTTYHGNKDSKKFHKSSCRYFNCKACTVIFQTREAALQAGYAPCKVCNPQTNQKTGR